MFPIGLYLATTGVRSFSRNLNKTISVILFQVDHLSIVCIIQMVAVPCTMFDQTVVRLEGPGVVRLEDPAVVQ